MKRRRRHQLVLGQDVIVTWLDSGAGVTDIPGKGNAKLVFKETHGKVSYLTNDPTIHKRVCTKDRCRCAYVELTMCSSGNDDDRSDLAVIWIDAIVEVKTFEAK